MLSSRSTCNRMAWEFVQTKVAKCLSSERTDASESPAADAIKVCALNANLKKWSPMITITTATSTWPMCMAVIGERRYRLTFYFVKFCQIKT